jgi:hypothetical protein
MTEDHRSPTGQQGQPQPENPEKEAALELLPAYALGATDPEETRLVKESLARFPHLIYELEIYTEMRRALTFSAPPAEIPAGAKSRILNGLLEATAPANTPTVSPSMSVRPQSSAPVVPATTSQTSDTNASFLDRLWRALVGTSGTPPLLRLSPVLALLAIALLVASNLYWAGQVRQLNDQQAQLVALTTQQNTLMTLINAGDVHRAQLAPTADGTGSEIVSVVWNPETEVAVLYAQQLPALSPDEIYQVWFIRDDQPVSAGLLNVAADGTGALVLHSPEPVGSFDVVGITVEPSTGSELPTSAPIAAGELRA